MAIIRKRKNISLSQEGTPSGSGEPASPAPDEPEAGMIEESGADNSSAPRAGEYEPQGPVSNQEEDLAEQLADSLLPGPGQARPRRRMKRRKIRVELIKEADLREGSGEALADGDGSGAASGASVAEASGAPPSGSEPAAGPAAGTAVGGPETESTTRSDGGGSSSRIGWALARALFSSLSPS